MSTGNAEETGGVLNIPKLTIVFAPGWKPVGYEWPICARPLRFRRKRLEELKDSPSEGGKSESEDDGKSRSAEDPEIPRDG
jgi:hypothetical protein